MTMKLRSGVARGFRAGFPSRNRPQTIDSHIKALQLARCLALFLDGQSDLFSQDTQLTNGTRAKMRMEVDLFRVQPEISCLDIA
jgi:hypothetical protein